MTSLRRIVTCGPVIASALVAGAVAGQDPACRVETVSRQALAGAIDSVVTAQGDFDLTTTTNWTRLESSVTRLLVTEALARRPEGGVLLIRAQDLFWEVYAASELTSTGLMPPHLLWELSLGTERRVAYRRDGVVRRVRRGEAPRLAYELRLSWPEDRGRDRYAYEDTASEPQLHVTVSRVLTTRVLEFGDMTVYDEVEGMSGRPLTGLLSVLFGFLGDARIVHSRAALADDGTQVVRGTARKGFIPRTLTVTVPPDGLAESGIPEHRGDLEEMEARLKEPLDVEYHDFRCW